MIYSRTFRSSIIFLNAIVIKYCAPVRIIQDSKCCFFHPIAEQWQMLRAFHMKIHIQIRRFLKPFIFWQFQQDWLGIRIMQIFNRTMIFRSRIFQRSKMLARLCAADVTRGYFRHVKQQQQIYIDFRIKIIQTAKIYKFHTQNIEIFLKPFSEFQFKNNFNKQYLSNNNKLNQMQKPSRSRPQHFSLDKGKLALKQQNQQYSGHKVIKYCHTVRETPDQYHILSIKQYKKQLDQMRRNYEELKRAYYYLLGYRIEGSDLVPKAVFSKDNNFLCVTEVSECNERSYHLNSSSGDVNENVEEIDQNRRKIARLTESIIEFGNKIITKAQKNQGNDAKLNKTKTQYDDQIEDQLVQTFKQIDRLKIALENTHQINEAERRQIRESYQEHIRKLEQILQRQRRHTKMLNGVIGRLRNQIEIKDSFIKSVMKLKNSDKNAIQKIVRQFKINSI